VEHIYRGFRISLRQDHLGWHAKFWRVSGTAVFLTAVATEAEGRDVCLRRAETAVANFLAYVGATTTTEP
jgi:hypothetical protein